jgi:cytochrome oxidase Cu insertion factor (SCO1/SenC/PrrC family)
MPGMSGRGPGDQTVISAFHGALIRQGALIFLLLALLLAVWNGFQSLQHRKARASGSQPVGAAAPKPAEPPARRVLRLCFGIFWLVAGLLQLQSGMPLGMSSGVLAPAGATSPAWVRSLVGFAATTWSHHPSEAAASAVWIQLGIGILLLVAPAGLWSRGAGLVSCGWGLVVWVFGEAFGGLFAPGLTVLFGAPGGVLLYVIAGALLALPYRVWIGRTLGQALTGSLGVFLLIMAGLQAWPGRGFWQGSSSGQPGTLAGMVRQMSTTPQPHVLSAMVSSFASFDQSHGFAVNLFAVVALAAIGAGFVWGRPLLLPALVALAVFAVADWVLIEDWGVWGGVGTDVNSMLPLLSLATVGYLAVERAPAVEGSAVADPAAASGLPWWQRIDGTYTRRLAAALGAVVILIVGVAPMVSASVDAQADAMLTNSVNSPPSVANGAAPDFHLLDQDGQPVSLASLRGYTVALTFLDPVCTTDCPIIAQEFRVADQLLGAKASKVRFVAIDANPAYTSVGVVKAFNRQEGLDDLSNWLFLTAPKATLQPIWDAYGVSATIAPAGGMADHSDLAYVIDAHGIARRAMGADPGDGESDHSSFSALLASEISQVMNQ